MVLGIGARRLGNRMMTAWPGAASRRGVDDHAVSEHDV